MLSKTHTKYIERLQLKKFRDETNLFMAEGPKVVLDLLADGKFVCKELFALKSWIDEHSIRLLSLKETIITEVADFELKKLSALTTSHSVLAIFEKRKQNLNFSTSDKITLVLDAIQDPGNLGTIIRIADWFGIENIVCAVGTTDMYNPKVVQSTMGSLGRVNIIYTDLVNWLQQHKEVKIFSASLEGKEIRLIGKLKEGFIIIGNEANGVSDEILKLVDEKITIPKTGQAESLNAAVATGIILSHIV